MMGANLSPCKGKSFKDPADCKAFALTGRLAACYYTQGDALGYELLGFQPVLESHARVESVEAYLQLKRGILGW